jgi:hypothetical protein
MKGRRFESGVCDQGQDRMCRSERFRIVGGVSMSDNSNGRLVRSEPSKIEAVDRPFNAKEKLKAFFAQLDARPFFKRKGIRKPKRDLPGRGSWLNYCCDRAIDAHTLHEALRWHKRVVGALTGIIETVSAGDWPTERKCKVLFELMHERARHYRDIVNIETALRRKDSADWSP